MTMFVRICVFYRFWIHIAKIRIARLFCAVDDDLAALVAPFLPHLAQAIVIAPRRRQRRLAVLAMIVGQVAAARRLVAVDLEGHVGHLMKRLCAAEAVLVNRGEAAQSLAPRMLAEARALEHAVLGKAIEPLLEAPLIDRVRVMRVQLANLFAILK